MRDDALEILRHLRMTVQEDIGIQKDIVEVHDPFLPAFLRIQLIDIAYTPPAHLGIPAYGLMIVHIGLSSNQIILRRRYAREHVSRLVDLIVQLQFLYTHLHRILRIRGVVYRERLREPQQIGILTQNTGEYGMECSHPQTARAVPAHYRRNPFLHFLGRLVGECQSNDRGGLHPGLNQARYLPRKHASFPGTGSGYYY